MDFATLCMVEANPGLYQNEITGLLGAEPPAVVLSLDRLEKGGYLIRRLSEHDRRLRTLHLTPSGRQLQKKVNAKVEQQERQIRQAVTSGFPELVAALDDLMRHYDLD
nr:MULTISPECIES: MarR family transcriptional regulator [unclassified Bradyrhizobium]